MNLDLALAHKLAAWNERRLLRDLYDCHFLAVRLGATPAAAVLDARLARIESRRPELRERKKMSRQELAAELRAFVQAFTQSAVDRELGPTLPAVEMAGLLPRLRSAAVRLAEWLVLPPA